MLIRGAIIGLNRVQIMGHWVERNGPQKAPINIPICENALPKMGQKHHNLSGDSRVVMSAIDVKVIIKETNLNKMFTLILMLVVVINTGAFHK